MGKSRQCDGLGAAHRVLSALTVLLPIALVAIVASQLTDYKWDLPDINSVEDLNFRNFTRDPVAALKYAEAQVAGFFSADCLLGDDANSESLCTYTYIATGFSFAVSALAAALQCCTFNCCGLGRAVDALVAAFGGFWWGAAAGVTTAGASRADDAGLPQADWRHAAVALEFFTAAAFAGTFVVGLVHWCRPTRRYEAIAE